MSYIDTINFNVGGYMRTSGKSMADVADYLGITPNALWMKLDGRTEFKLSEVLTLSSIIGITPDELVGFTAESN